MTGPGIGVERWTWIPSVQQAPDLYAGAARFTTNGAGRLLWIYEEAGQHLVDAIHRDTRAHIYPVVPNMAAYARDTRDRSPIVAILQRFLRLGLRGMTQVARTNMVKLLDVLGQDFSTGALILAEMEIVRFRRYQPEIVFLNNQIVDLAMAFDNRKLFAQFQELARKRHGLGVGIVTFNYGLLAPKLAEWGIKVDRIIAPFNKRGYLMHRSKQECEQWVAEHRSALIASEFDAAGTIPDTEALAYLGELGIQAVASRWSDNSHQMPDELGSKQ